MRTTKVGNFIFVAICWVQDQAAMSVVSLTNSELVFAMLLKPFSKLGKARPEKNWDIFGLNKNLDTPILVVRFLLVVDGAQKGAGPHFVPSAGGGDSYHWLLQTLPAFCQPGEFAASASQRMDG